MHSYITGDQIASADWVTFIWTHRFPLTFYAPAVLPLLVASIVAATECIGDVTATTEASGLPPYGTRKT
jgi:NCS2 family nucleobase:cation symporter-2